jgi:ABC-2 type transport system ATP-binding protein
MKILLGLSRPTSGNGTIFGHNIETESVAIRERIGYLPQQPRFIEDMTARENLQFTAKFFFSGPQLKIQERCDEMLELVGLAEKADRPIQGFSGGEKQRLGIALAQVNYPDLIILDEPASALDPLGRQDVLDVMARLRKYTTIFYSTHILDDVQRVSDTVAILKQGELVASGPIEQVLSGKDGVVYSVSLRGTDSAVLGKRLAKLPWVTNTILAQQNGTSVWQVSVSDEATAERDLLRYILADPAVTVAGFNRKKYELEEVFMEIVKGDGNVS